MPQNVAAGEKTTQKRDSIYDLVHFAMNTDYDSLPESAVKGAKMLLMDILATCAAGYDADGVAEVAKVLNRWGGIEESRVVVFGNKLPVYSAGLLNSVISHARDYDEVQPNAVVHTGVSVIPTVLSVADAVGGISGKKLITTICVTVDFFVRMGLCIKIPGGKSGWIYSPLIGNFASALAAGLLLDLSEEQLVNAVGIAYSQAGGIIQASVDTTLAKRMQPGFAVRSGILAAYLAKEGVTGARNIIDGKYNFFHVYLHDEADRAPLLDQLGEKWWIETLSYKPYPVCGQCLCPASTTDRLVKENSIAPSEITGIDIGTNEHGYSICVEPEEVKFHPKKVVDAQFSIPYAVATIASHGHLTVGDLSMDGISDEETIKMMAKVHPYVDKTVEKAYPRGIAPAQVTIHTTRGDFSASGYYKGHPSNPFSMDDIKNKLYDAVTYGARQADRKALEKTISIVDGLEAIADTKELLDAYDSIFNH